MDFVVIFVGSDGGQWSEDSSRGLLKLKTAATTADDGGAECRRKEENAAANLRPAVRRLSAGPPYPSALITK